MATFTPRRGILVLCTALALTGCAPEGRYPGANVVLISIDTLGADHLSLYGYSRPTSPFLEQLAEEAVVFDQFVINGGFTLPSHATMMTSLTPLVHRVGSPGHEVLPEGRVTLAEQLRSRGYRTAAFVDAGFMLEKFGFGQGFEVYDDEGGRFQSILPKAYQWLAEHHQDPFLLFLHTYDVHSQWGGQPYNCPAPYPDTYTAQYDVDFDGCRRGRCASGLFRWIAQETRAGRLTPTDVLTLEEIELSEARYDGCINYVDAKIADLVFELESHDLLDRTLIVITSDHGEEFLEHGLLLHMQHGFEEMSRVPLIVRFPRGELGGRRVPHLTAMIDLMPTILDAVEVPVTREAQGRSLLGAVLRDERVRRDTTIWSVLRTDRWKLMPDRKMLFDLEHDPAESRNLWSDGGEILQQLHDRQRLHVARSEELAERLASDGATPRDADLDDEELEGLRALGYVVD